MRRALPIFAALLLSACDSRVAAVGQGQNHRVKPGESLFAIAERAYQNGLEWPRIWEANPWVDPDQLRAGEIIFVPARDESWGDPPSRRSYFLDPGAGDFEDSASVSPPAAGVHPGTRRISSNPGSGSTGLTLFRNLASNVSTRTLFGLPLEKVLLFLFLSCLLHALFQGVLVWLAANFTFVKDASFKKALKAVLLTEMLTFSTLVVLAGAAIFMLYLGTDPGAGGQGAGQLFPSLEGYLESPTGMAVAAFAVLSLYVILSLRFLPQVFGVPTGRAMTIMTLAILVPHLVGFYLIGQRTGIIQ